MFILRGTKRQVVPMLTDKPKVLVWCRCDTIVGWEPLNKPEAKCPVCKLGYKRVPQNKT